MTIKVIRGTHDKPAITKLLIEALSNQESLEGELFIGYPTFGTPTGPTEVDALLLSRKHGIVIFDLIEGRDTIDKYPQRQDDLENLLDSRLRIHSRLVKRRELQIPIHAITYTSTNSNSIEGDDYIICTSDDDLTDALKKIQWSESNERIFELASSVISNVTSLRTSRPRRSISKSNSRGAKIQKIDESIVTLDYQQNRAVIESVDGIQRIRGLAGSGKTIVLALKAAYLHAKHPDWRIAVTFHTRSLKSSFRKLIHQFHYEQTTEEPNWKNLQIVNAWGSPTDTQPGLYFEYTKQADVPFMDFRQTRERFGTENAFAGACEAALANGDSQPIYDAILIDEAQDLPPEFLRLCYRFLKEPFRLVYAYDELQNLNRESLPSPEEIFGNAAANRVTEPTRDQAQSDVVLDVCYRNPSQILTSAHALGFGIYRRAPRESNSGLVQMFENQGLWLDVGYEEVEGRSLTPSQPVRLKRRVKSSPPYLVEYSDTDDIVVFKRFDSASDQAKWLANQIEINIKEDDLCPADILIVHPDAATTHNQTAELRSELFAREITPYLAGADGHADVFRPDNQSVIVSSVHRAKGNEAAMVYVMDADRCQSASWNLASKRNCLYSAITRSKAWVRVVGVGARMDELQHEFKQLIENEFSLKFRYPTSAELKHMRIAYRDRSQTEERYAKRGNSNLNALVTYLESGDVKIDDLDPDRVSNLKQFLQSSS